MKRTKKLHNLPIDTVYDQIVSPVGLLTLFVSSRGIHALMWEGESSEEILKHFKKNKNNSLIEKAKQQLKEYFAGKRTSFDLPLHQDGTPFQIQAWNELSKIPYGQTISYGEQAKKIGDKNKARAVGLANGLNPISIIVPCHRVIGSNGHLTGFGGGLDNKAKLLKLEQHHSPQ